MLEVRNLSVVRGAIQVVWDVSLEVGQNEVVAIIGSNGAGKTTVLSAIVGLLRPSSGRVYFLGQDITGSPPHKNVDLGLSLVPEDMKLFGNCSVKENLLLGAYSPRAKGQRRGMLSLVYEIFPPLKAKQGQLCSTLSGGEQRMLAIARGLMSNPRLLILDEPSQGLSPRLTLEVFKTVERLKERGLSVLIVEQNVYHALKVSDRAYVMETGRITLEGGSPALMGNDYVRTAFLGS
jgi:branched-chain amino acid transport system ATP-binding protein